MAESGTRPGSSPNRKGRGIRWAVALALYVAVYTYLSSRGRYLGHNAGGQDNRDTWAPAHCAEIYTSPVGREKLRLTALGWLFLPPLIIDQWFIHRTRTE